MLQFLQPLYRIIAATSTRVRAMSVAFLAMVIASIALWQSLLSVPNEFLLGGREFSERELTDMAGAFARAELDDYELVGNKLRVPRRQRQKYLRALVDSNAMPQDLDLLDAETSVNDSIWTTSQQRLEQSRLAKQRRIATMLRAMRDIHEATVEFDTERGGGWNKQQRATALVAVRARQGIELDQRRLDEIRQMVASAIGGLSAENVVVADLDASGRETPHRLDASTTGSATRPRSDATDGATIGMTPMSPPAAPMVTAETVESLLSRMGWVPVIGAVLAVACMAWALLAPWSDATAATAAESRSSASMDSAMPNAFRVLGDTFESNADGTHFPPHNKHASTDRNLRETLSSMVREDPQSAAAVLRQWIGKAG
ncbi:MAG: hypothetical protein KDA99_25965 [Planctomycetales bacterium]|nr:hypothetical protein [Planctomycetales bacterium]